MVGHPCPPRPIPAASSRAFVTTLNTLSVPRRATLIWPYWKRPTPPSSYVSFSNSRAILVFFLSSERTLTISIYSLARYRLPFLLRYLTIYIYI